MNLGHNCIGMSRLWSLLLPTSVYNIFVRIYWTLEKLCNFPNFGVAEYIAYLRDLQHKISKCLRWRTCCSDEFEAQLYWQESSMKYCSHIGAVVVENVRIYHDLGYILVICEYLQHKILECLRRRAKPTDAFAAAYNFLQVSTTYL